MTPPPNSAYKYQVGGSLSIDHPSYVKRWADVQLYQALMAGEFCYVLNSRQMGKSSLRVQTMHRLQAEGVACADIDISLIGNQLMTPDEWYGGFVNLLYREFNLAINLKDWWYSHEHIPPVLRLSEFIEDVLLLQVSQDIVIFIDEIDGLLTLDFKDDFFGLIRACYNKRADRPEYRRLTFAMLGVATPSDLIQDKTKSPFNIGKAIELNGFSLDDVKPLALGLAGTVNNFNAALKEVLDCTGGQPFLTQKLCKLIATLSSPIPQGSEAKYIKNLVRSSVIENWETQDVPQHFKTIRDRILGSKSRTVALLGNYQKILENGQIVSDDSPTQIELRLSGLVVKESHFLKVYNRIYKEVFNETWVEAELKNLRPYAYAESLKAWLKSNRQDSYLLRGKELQDALNWATDKSLSAQDDQFLRASQKLVASNAGIQANRWKQAAAAVVMTATLWGGFVWWQKSTSCPDRQAKLNNACLLILSSGENSLFRSNYFNLNLEKGNEAFKSNNYSEAIKFFQKAVDGAPNDPEPQIYLNNAQAQAQAQARQKGSPFRLAAVVPIENYTTDAQEVLRGVADAQTKFNNAGGLNGRLLEIFIANDGNSQKVATEKVAQQLTVDQKVLGVIGHNSSEASFGALPEYEKAGLAMVSPTSTSSKLKSRVFFRTVPSTKLFALKLAEYAKTTLGLDKVVIFFDSKGTYSPSAKQDIEKELSARKVSIVRTVDLSDGNFDAEAEVERSVKQDQVRAVILLPGVQTTSVAISIARENAKLPQAQRLQLFGAGALYSPNTLKQGGSAVEGLTLAVAWFDDGTPSYAQAARQRWKGQINWRTAAGYDAAQALIKALSKDATRETVLKNLKSVDLAPNETSGRGLKFSEGEPINREYRLVRVGKSKTASEVSQYGFQLLE